MEARILGDMTAILLLAAGMAFVVVPATWLMMRVDRADQRRIDRIRAEWEAGDREMPWSYGLNWAPVSSGGSL